MNEIKTLPKRILTKIEMNYKTIKTQKYVKEKLTTLLPIYTGTDVYEVIDGILKISVGEIDIFDKIFELKLFENQRALMIFGMEKLPKDILARIKMDYKTGKSEKYVKEKLSTLFFTYIGVSVHQLMRGILIIANGKIEEIDKIFESNFHGDPRDLLMYANSIDNKTHYGINPFIIKEE